MPNMDMTESIIEAIKSYPVLYNPEHEEFRNTRKKNQAWSQLGSEFGEPGETIKRKWKNIRDSYAKYLRSLEMDPESIADAKHAKFWGKWRFASNMEPFKPFLAKHTLVERDQLQQTSVERQISETEFGQANPGCSQNFVSLYDEEFKDESPDAAYNHKKRKHEHLRKHNKEYDALEHLFLYYAKTMKGFMPRRQIQAKMRIAQVMMEEEMEDQNEKQSLADVHKRA